MICNFLLEHLEQPQQLFDVVKQGLEPGGSAFVTGALTASQIDHIYEYKRESELFIMAEQAGLRVRESTSFNPTRLLRKARFIPRVMSLILSHEQEP